MSTASSTRKIISYFKIKKKKKGGGKSAIYFRALYDSVTTELIYSDASSVSSRKPHAKGQEDINYFVLKRS